MPANVFEWDGWQGQYARMARWLKRFLEVANDWQLYTLDEQIDFALVFFQNAYHLRDYLLHEKVVSQHALDELMAQSRVMRVARDLTNGSKHRVFSKPPSIDSSPWILRSLNFGGEPRLTLKAGSELADLVAVACECVETWQTFLDGQSLDPRSMSPARRAMTEALRRSAEERALSADP